MNRVMLVCRTVKDCYYTETTIDKKCCKFMVACKGEYYEDGDIHTDFIKCVAWEKNAETMVRYIHKGDLIAISGSLNVRSFDDNGKKQYVTEVLVQKVELLSKVEKADTDTNNDTKDDILPF